MKESKSIEILLIASLFHSLDPCQCDLNRLSPDRWMNHTLTIKREPVLVVRLKKRNDNQEISPTIISCQIPCAPAQILHGRGDLLHPLWSRQYRQWFRVRRGR